MGVRQPLFEEAKVRSKPHGEQQFRLSWGTEKECTLWLYWSLAVCCVQKGSGAPAHLLPSCSHRHTPAKQGKHESSRHHRRFWFSSSQSPNPVCSLEAKSTQQTYRVSFSTSQVKFRGHSALTSCKILRAWTPCNEGLAERKWKSHRVGALPHNLRNTRATKHPGWCLHQEEVKKEAWIK